MKKLAFTLIVVFLGCLLFPYSLFSKTAWETLQTSAETQNITLRADIVKLRSPLRLSIKGLSAIVPVGKLPLPLQFESLEVRGSWLSLLLLTLNAELSAEGYSGTISSDINKSVFSDLFTNSIEIDHLHLDQHPLFKFAKFSGTIDIKSNYQFKVVQQKQAQVVDGSFDVTLKDGNYKGGHSVSLFTFPKVRHIGLKTIGAQKGDKLSIEKFNLKSSLGILEASGVCTINTEARNLNQAVNSGELSAKLQLSDEGVKELGGYLALAANANVDNPPRNWQITYEKFRNRQPSIRVTPQ